MRARVERSIGRDSSAARIGYGEDSWDVTAGGGGGQGREVMPTEEKGRREQ
jgi:hypothetical protein